MREYGAFPSKGSTYMIFTHFWRVRHIWVNIINKWYKTFERTDYTDLKCIINHDETQLFKIFCFSIEIKTLLFQPRANPTISPAKNSFVSNHSSTAFSYTNSTVQTTTMKTAGHLSNQPSFNSSAHSVWTTQT